METEEQTREKKEPLESQTVGSPIASWIDVVHDG